MFSAPASAGGQDGTSTISSYSLYSANGSEDESEDESAAQTCHPRSLDALYARELGIRLRRQQGLSCTARPAWGFQQDRLVSCVNIAGFAARQEAA